MTLRFAVAASLAATIICAAAARAPSSTSTLPAASDELIRSGLKDLHDGLYGKAEKGFRTAMRSAPGDPTPALFIAFAYWWRLIQDRSDATLVEPFIDAVETTVEDGERRIEAAPEDLRVLTCIGTAHILRSQVEGMRRNFFKAGQEARRGKKRLEAVLLIDPNYQDALFGLGAYNYYTEKIPGFARGLLFMPRGNAEEGLRQLKRAAASDSYFSTDASLLLALICGSRDEHCYDDALAHLGAALVKNPRSPLVLGSIGGIKMRLGYYGDAIRALEEALAAAAGEDTGRAEQRRILKLYLAEALAADWRLQRALEALRAIGDGATLPARERRVFEHVVDEIAQKRGQPRQKTAAVVSVKGPSGTPLADRVQAALAAHDDGRDSEALAILGEAAEAFPGDPLPRFLLGRVHFEQGHFPQAESDLAVARALAHDPPAWMAGWTELYRGLAQNALGHRSEAQEHFRAASEIKRFRSAERGLVELLDGAAPHGRCRP